VKNITVSIPDEVYRAARIRAAEMDTSVTSLVREYLEKLTKQNEDFRKRVALQRRVIASIKNYSASERLSREKIHDRNALR
jgi:plasmid stability protein